MQIDLPDRIELARAQWADEEPGLDTSPMEVIGRILRAAHLADAHIRRVLRQESLDRSGFDVLATLRRTGPPYQLTPTALYQELVLTSGAMTHRVDALARAGLVERISGPPRPPQQPRRPDGAGQVGRGSRHGRAHAMRGSDGRVLAR